MQIRKTYKQVNPELLYAEIKDFALKQGVTLDEAKMETYALPADTSSFVSRGTLSFSAAAEGKTKKCLRAHVVGSAKTETKLMLDIDETIFTAEKAAGLQADLDFIFSAYEVK
jgi:hypothetical protein